RRSSWAPGSCRPPQRTPSRYRSRWWCWGRPPHQGFPLRGRGIRGGAGLRRSALRLVPEAGLETAWVSPHAPPTVVSANSTTPARSEAGEKILEGGSRAVKLGPCATIRGSFVSREGDVWES